MMGSLTTSLGTPSNSQAISLASSKPPPRHRGKAREAVCLGSKILAEARDRRFKTLSGCQHDHQHHQTWWFFLPILVDEMKRTLEMQVNT